MAVKRILTWLKRLVLACLALLVLLCVYVLLVNRHDQPPSKTVLRFESLLHDLPPVADKDNGYVYFVGISAPRNVEPHFAGMVRIAWAKQWMGYTELGADKFPGKVLDIDGGRSEAVKSLAAQCKEVDINCARALDSGAAVISQWLASDKFLVERYNTLLTYPEWRETLLHDDRLPVMPFVTVLEGQKVHLLAAWERAGQGDGAGVKAALDSDMRFWRRNLAATDTLIGKMIASSALRRNFAWGNLILRRLPSDKVASAIPALWREPVSAQERSMLRSLAGEWRSNVSQLKKVTARDMNEDVGSTYRNIVRAVTDSVTRSTLQYQATSNQYAELMASTADAYAVSYEQIPAAIPAVRARTGKLQENVAGLPGYNLLGNVLFRVGSPDMTRYALRMSDLEGIRRATLLMAELHSRALGPADIEAQLAASHAGSPYDGKPFAWDAQAKAIVFIGLEEGKWGRTSVPY